MQGHAEDTALKWVTNMYVWQWTKPLLVRWACNAVMKQNHRPISRVWISCNFYCTFLFGLATTFHLFQRLRPRSWPNTQVGSGMKFPRVTDRRSDLKHREVILILDLWPPRSQIMCIQDIQWARDRSDIMEGTRKYSGERMNFLDSTLMHSQWKEILPL